MSAIFPTGILLFLWFQTYRKHSWDRHRVALKKAGFIWVFSSLPWVLSLLFNSPDQNAEESATRQFFSEMLSSFTFGEMFVYSAAFLAPVVYIAVEAVIKVQEDRENEEKKWEDYSRQLRGIGSVVVISIFMLLVTAFSFAKAKEGEATVSYFLHIFGGHPIAVYLVSIALWYAVVLAEVQGNFASGQKARASAQNLADALKKNLGVGN